MNSLGQTRTERRIVQHMRSFREEVTSDTVIYAVALAYALFAAVWLGGLPATSGAGAIRYGEIVGLVVGALFVPTVAAGLALAAVFVRPVAPLRQIGTWLAAADPARLLAGLALLLPVSIFLSAFGAVKVSLSAGGFDYDRPLADIGWYLFLGQNPIDVLHALFDPAVFAPVIDYIYSTTWFFWVYGILFYMAVCGAAQRRRRYFVGMFAAWALLGNAMASALISAGPCYYGAVTGDTARFGPAMEALRAAIGSETGAMAFQALLWRMYESGQIGVGAGISAFPSMHVAAAALSALVLAERGRGMAIIGWTYTGIILFGSVYLGWHYLIDGLFSILAVWVIHRAMLRIFPDRMT